MSWFNKGKKRTETMEQLAKELEMSFKAKDEYGLKNLLKDFNIAKRGHSNKIKNILQKKEEEQGFDIRIFDYHYIIQAGSTAVPVSHTVFFVQSKKLELPQFLLKPENFFHKIDNYLGLQQDIDFEQFPEFSDQYLLQGEEEDLVRKEMSDEVLKFFTIEKDWCLEGLNYFLIFYPKKGQIPKEKINLFYEKGIEIYKMLVVPNIKG